MQFSKLFLTLAAPAYVLAAASLRDIAPLPSDEVTLGCYNQYNAPIPSCSTNELKSKICSEDCADDLNAHATAVILACRLAFVGPDTLLRKIMDGGLVVTVCHTVREKEGSSDDEDEEETVSTTAVRSATPTTKSAGIVETGAAEEEEEEDTTDDGAVEEDETPAKTSSGAQSSVTPEADEEEQAQDDDILGGGAQDDEDDEGTAGKNIVVGWALGMVVAAVAAVVV